MCVSVSQVLHPSFIDNIALLNGSFVSIGDIRAIGVLTLNLRAVSPVFRARHTVYLPVG
jgi:hypothetical protein